MSLITNFTGYTRELITIGRSGAKVEKLSKLGEVFYLKTSVTSDDPDPGKSLKAEAERLHWLQNKLPVPEVLAFESQRDEEQLLMSALPGKSAACVNSHAEALANIPALLEALTLLSNIDISYCPFKQDIPTKLKQAEERLRLGLILESEFDECRKGHSAKAIFQQAVERADFRETFTFTHGDFCLPNIIIANGRLSGLVDIGRSGIADPYQDLSLLLNSIYADYNPLYGEPAAKVFLTQLGKPHLLKSKIQYYQLLDELF